LLDSLLQERNKGSVCLTDQEGEREREGGNRES